MPQLTDAPFELTDEVKSWFWVSLFFAQGIRRSGLRVIKVDVDKNKELSKALRIKGLPILMIYKKGEMVWRQSGEQDANTLMGVLNEYIYQFED